MNRNLTDIHPDELIFRDFLTELDQILIKCKGRYLDEYTKEHLRKVRLQVFEIQGNRASSYVNKKSEFEEPPEQEKDTLRKLGEYIEKITELLDEDIMDFYNSIGGQK